VAVSSKELFRRKAETETGAGSADRQSRAAGCRSTSSIEDH